MRKWIGIKQIIRRPIGTALFIILIALLTFLLCSGIIIGKTSDKAIKNAKDSFKTIAIVNYPSENSDDSLFLEQVKKLPYVKVDRRSYLCAYDEDMNPYETLETSEMMCVITVTEVSNNMNFTGIVDEVLYTYESHLKPGTKINFNNELAEYKGDIAVGDRYLCFSFGNIGKDGGNYSIQDFYIYMAMKIVIMLIKLLKSLVC